MTAAAVLLAQLDFDRGIEVTGVAFVGVDVDFELGVFVGPHEQVFKDDRALRRFDPQPHEVAVLHAVVRGVIEIHVDVAGGADHTFAQLDDALGADEHAAGSPLDVAAVADRGVDAERDGVGKGQLDLAVRTSGAKHAHRRQHSPPRADDHHCLLGGIKTVLIQRLLGN